MIVQTIDFLNNVVCHWLMRGSGARKRDNRNRDPDEPDEDKGNHLRWLGGALCADCWKGPVGTGNHDRILVLDAFGGQYAIGLPDRQDANS